MKDSLDFVVI